MKLAELAQILGLRPLTPGLAAAVEEPDSEVTRGYASDLLSDVLANAPRGAVLVTLQVHLNVVAVASHAGLRAVIFSSGRLPDAEVIARAEEEGVALYSSQADTFDLVGRLYQLGLRGSKT